ncbi:MAG: tetratricopeptide repeat protein [Desulfobacterales bacterium]
MLTQKRISPPLPQPSDTVTAKQDVSATAKASQPADTSSKQELKQNEAKNNITEQQASLISAKTNNTIAEEKPHGNKPDSASKPELLSKPALKKTSSAALSSPGAFPHQATAKPSELIKPFYEKAVRYHRQNRLKEAIMMYRQVLNKDPQNKDTQFNLACAYIENREFAAALPILYDLHEKDPNNPLVMINLAIAGIETGEPAMAITLLDAAQKITGVSLFDIYFHKAAALSHLGKLDEAKQFYEMAEKKDPGNIRLIFNMAVLYDKIK